MVRALTTSPTGWNRDAPHQTVARRSIAPPGQRRKGRRETALAAQGCLAWGDGAADPEPMR